MTLEEAMDRCVIIRDTLMSMDLTIVSNVDNIEWATMCAEAIEKMKELEKGIADIEDTLNDAYTLNDFCLNKVIRKQPMSECECIAESFSLKAMQNLDWLLGVIKRSDEDEN